MVHHGKLLGNPLEMEGFSWEKGIIRHLPGLGLFNIAMGDDPFIDGLPNLKMGGFSMAMLNNQRVFFVKLCATPEDYVFL